MENQIDPETNEPLLQKIAVRLLEESDEEAIRLPPYLREGYKLAEAFCEKLGERIKSAGFLRTLLNQERDPKYAVVRQCLLERGWVPSSSASTGHPSARACLPRTGSWDQVTDEQRVPRETNRDPIPDSTHVNLRATAAIRTVRGQRWHHPG